MQVSSCPLRRNLLLGSWVSALLLIASTLGAYGCSEEAGGGWSGAEEVDPNPPAFYQTLLASGDGRTLAVWRGPNPDTNPEPPKGFDGISASWKAPGAGWAPAAVVDAFESLPFPPAAAAGAEGRAIIVWGEPAARTEPQQVWASQYAAGSTWREPELLGDAGGLRESPLVATGVDGRTFVTWLRQSGSMSDIALTELEPDGDWGPVQSFPIETDPGGATSLGLGVDGDGRAVLAWWSWSGTFVNRFTPGEGWGTASSFNDEQLPGPPLVDIDANGTVWAFWPARADLAQCVGASRNTASGWESATLFDPGCSRGAGGAISADGVGGATVIWGTGFSDDAVAFWSRYRVGEGWTPVAAAPMGLGTGQAFWGLGAQPEGDTVALWYRSAIVEGSDFGGQLAVWTGTLSAQDRWSEPRRLSERGPWPSPNAPFRPPRVVSHPHGRAVGLWAQPADPDDRSGFSNTLWSADYR